MKKTLPILIVAFSISALLFWPSTTVNAGGPEPPQPPGKGSDTGNLKVMSVSVTHVFPGNGSSLPGQGTSPALALPHGTASVEIGISYSPFMIRGYGSSSIGSDGLGYWKLCAGVIYLKKNGSTVRSAGTSCDQHKLGGSTKTTYTSWWFGSVTGVPWQESTYHQVYSETFGDNFEPTLTQTFYP